MNDLYRLTAQEAVGLLKRGEVSPEELVEAAAERIQATDGVVNALPTLCLDRARERAKRLAKRRSAKGRSRLKEARGGLYGLPIAVKDLVDVAGVRTTYGSPLFADHVPSRSDVLVERLEAKGAIVLAKSNTPEFGAGANTFNEVFGATRNPWDARLTSGGSSGGAAAALAAGQVWLATGSDLGGSIRIPASFCSVVGLRPSPGLVAAAPRTLAFEDMSVKGPMGRTVGDVALMLDAMVGHDPRDPLSFPARGASFVRAAARPRAPRRVGFSPDLGIAPVEPEVARICEQATHRFTDLGAEVDAASPDFDDAAATFRTLRAAIFVASLGPLVHRHRASFKPEIVWNVEKGLAAGPEDLGAALRARAALYERVAAFFQAHDLLATPAVVAPPFPVEERYLTEVAGVVFENYTEWLVLTSTITLTSCPAISLPCGFTEDGRPVGLQLVGRPRGEHALIAAAASFERLVDLARRVPLDPRRLAPSAGIRSP